MSKHEPVEDYKTIDFTLDNLYVLTPSMLDTLS